MEGLLDVSHARRLEGSADIYIYIYIYILTENSPLLGGKTDFFKHVWIFFSVLWGNNWSIFGSIAEFRSP